MHYTLSILLLQLQFIAHLLLGSLRSPQRLDKFYINKLAKDLFQEIFKEEGTSTSQTKILSFLIKMRWFLKLTEFMYFEEEL